MSQSVTLNGQTYTIPDVSEENWGQNVTDYLVAVAVTAAGAAVQFLDFVNVTSSPVTGVSGKTYLVDTSSARTINLPTPANNAYIQVKDKTGSAATNNITIARNGSENIDGVAGSKVLNVNYGAWLIMSDGTDWFTIGFVDTYVDAITPVIPANSATDLTNRIAMFAYQMRLLNVAGGNWYDSFSWLAGLDDTATPADAATDLEDRLDQLAAALKAITGEANWKTAPAGGALTAMVTATAAKLPLAGGTMSGDIAMGSNKLTGLAAGTTSGHSVRYEQVNYLWRYRRPVLQYVSATTVTVETGVNGTSGAAEVLFPDGDLRQDSTSSHIIFDITRNAALSGTAQSGLRTSLSEATNTWYALYAVKVSDSSTDFVIVGDTTLPLQANYSTLNTNFGTNSWVYLGMVRNGDASTATGDILNFIMAGNFTSFINTADGAAEDGAGIVMASGTAATVSYTYAAGTGAAQIPNHINIVDWMCSQANGTAPFTIGNQGGSQVWGRMGTIGDSVALSASGRGASSGVRNAGGSSVSRQIYLCGFHDAVLGVGPNPRL